MDTITIDDFAKLDLRVAVIVTAEAVEGTDKLVKMSVNAGDKDADGNPVNRTIVAGIRPTYSPERLVGGRGVIVANLTPRKMRGIESHGMFLAAKDENNLSLIQSDIEVQAGAKVG